MSIMFINGGSVIECEEKIKITLQYFRKYYTSLASKTVLYEKEKTLVPYFLEYV